MIPDKMNIQQLSELTGMHRTTVSSKLTTANVPFEDGPQKSKVYVVRNALPVIYNTGDSSQVETQQEQEKLLQLSAKRQLLELELAERQRQVIPINEVLESVGREYTFIRAQLRSMPSNLAKHVAINSDPQACYELISASVETILNELKSDAKEQLETLPVAVEPVQDVASNEVSGNE